MKKIVLTILIILLCFQFLKAQELTIDDLQKVVISQSIDRADSILRLKKYKLDGLLKEGDTTGRYRFVKSKDPGSLDFISIRKNKEEDGTFEVMVFYDSDEMFYRLKQECEKLREIQKVDEYTGADNSFNRKYCDRFFTYVFSMSEDENIKNINKMLYTVFVVFHSHPCQKSK